MEKVRPMYSVHELWEQMSTTIFESSARGVELYSRAEISMRQGDLVVE